jgi:hypothetical protein
MVKYINIYCVILRGEVEVSGKGKIGWVGEGEIGYFPDIILKQK